MRPVPEHRAERRAKTRDRNPASRPEAGPIESPLSGDDVQPAVLFETVLDSLTHPLYVIDVADYHVRLANRAAQEACRNEAATCYALSHRLDLPCNTADHPCPIEIIKETGRPTIVEHVHYDADGRPRNVEVHAFPIFDHAHKLVQIIEYCVDITERKQDEEALRDAHERVQMQAEQLRAANEELRELAGTLESKVARRTSELERRARQLQRLTVELSEAEDRERKRLAGVLHDDLQQVLAAAKFHLTLLANRAKHDPSQQGVIARIDEMLKDAIDKSRSLSHELSPAVLRHGDLVEILGWLAGEVQAKHGLAVRVDANGTIGSPSDAIKALLYKSTREMLFNVVKHAEVDEARIRVRRRGRSICLSVSDSGRGFDPQELKGVAGFGLFSIRERIELLGGRMKIRSAKGRGSTFHIVLPETSPLDAVPHRQREAVTGWP
jgi:signal transduction histidine kinase